MTINSITANPVVLDKLKQAIGGGGIQNVISLDTNINSNVINDVAELSLNNDIEINNINILDQIKLNGLEGNNNDVLISQGVGQPNIWAPMPTIPDTLISNSLYVNDNIDTIQSKINLSNQGDVIYISAGSYGEPQILIDNKYNMALSAPPIGTSTICEILNGFNITNTSELIRVSNLAIKGISSLINPVGRCIFHNVVFVGVAGSPHNIIIGNGTTKYLTFNQVEFDTDCIINVPATFASVIYFLNCNFSSASISLNNSSPLQVIFNNCGGFVSFPVNATYIGLNVLTSGISKINTYDLKTTLINGASYPPSTIIINNQADNRLITCTSTNNTLDGESNLTWDGINKLGMTTTNNNFIIGGGSVSQSFYSGAISLGSGVVGNGSVNVGTSSYIGNASVCVGSSSGKIGITGSYNTILGYFAGRGLTIGGGNVIVGGNCAQNVSSGNNNILISGGSTLTTGSNNVLIGGGGGTTQSNNTVVGVNSGTSTFTNCSILGSNINVIDGSNQVQLGDSLTNTYIYGVLQIRSDKRDKADIETLNESEGLDLINRLNPVKFKYDYREDYIERIYDASGNETIINHPQDGSKKRSRYHYGLIAQEVEELINTNQISDFGLLQNHNLNGEKYTLGYEELIGSLIKAVQQLSHKVKILESV